MSVKFSAANAKIKALVDVKVLRENFLIGAKALRKVYSFDLASGWSCPFANECFSKVIVTIEGRHKIKDGANTQFRCFSASQEVAFPSAYNLRMNNFNLMRVYKNTSDMVEAIQEAMPQNLGICRIHVAGDFFNQDYFDAWLQIALDNPSRLFYAYTKSLNYWYNRKNDIPNNFILTASLGGRLDHLIPQYGLRTARVVFSEEEAAELGLEIDHTDEHAANPFTKDKDFALLIHGQQPAGSEASLAIKELKSKGVKFSYSSN